MEDVGDGGASMLDLYRNCRGLNDDDDIWYSIRIIPGDGGGELDLE